MRTKKVGVASLAAMAALVLGCQGDSAIHVDFRVVGSGDQLCVLAFADNEVVFSESYSAAVAGMPPHGSLTFLAGDETDDVLQVTGRLDRGGVIQATGTNELSFEDGNVQRRALDVKRCHERSARIEEPPLTEIARVSPALTDGLVATDVDGDGRDEILLLTEQGSLLKVDWGVTEPSWLDPTSPADSILVAAGDIDRNCQMDVISLAPDEVWTARNPLDGQQLLKLIRPSVKSATVGGIREPQVASLYTTSPIGIQGYVLGVDQSYGIDTYAAMHVLAADFTADGRDDLVASGAMGVKLFVGTTQMPMPGSTTLPELFATVNGPLAAGDLDADGFVDFVGSSAAGIVVARNDGSGELVDAVVLPDLEGDARSVLAADIDGDCRDDVVAIAADGMMYAWRSEAPFGFDRISILSATVDDMTAGDIDGDGAKELVVLSNGTFLEVWGL